ncbi:AAA family ATPase [uncultured Clostridium sp.]|uniref:AAA family ATPase n=1 Tax=uncultured Clostridium sp. TaxID=59620 RepID=UPI0026F3E943|nr:AAA family ATPase [uncultured Clostridium sp.]
MKIAIFGKIRSGKNTVADILTEEYGFKQFAFGGGIGEIIQKYFPEAFEGGKPRLHYQHIGQQLRVLNEDVWINYLLKDVEKYKKDCSFLRVCPKNIVVTDGRQVNEAKRLKEEGYLIVKVTTDSEIRLNRMKALGDVFNKEDLLHETELNVDLIEPDVEIFNNGTYEELKDTIQKLIKDIERGMFSE